MTVKKALFLNIYTFCSLQKRQGSLFVTDGTSLTGNVSFVSREQVTCQLPDSGIYNVSVSNDGNSFGAELTYIGYDSSCYSCDLSGCSQRVGQNCVIESP